eukprot:TRINITY_DN50167_c0_g1_i1.p2 TRINITY_DN50167_c0_g1~~TRINITY_DN50167_c0_g1_i1.p2  ORF type:complete len:135 (-),score=41.11 TRINITY_DN50167_c0_g1_i1:532-936(-)
MVKAKFLTQSDLKVGLIGDEETVTGMVLAGIGHVDGQGRKNFMAVDSKTHRKDIDEKFKDLTSRKDIAMVVITQNCADEIRATIEEYNKSGKVVPTVMEIPQNGAVWDPKKDSIMQRVLFFMPTAAAGIAGFEA